MRLFHFSFAVISCFRPVLTLSNEQAILYDSSQQAVKNVAIIGAGAAGSSSAYYLSKFAEDAGILVNITIFERNSYVGGRSTTVNAHDDPSIPVELGASIFVDVNAILVNATRDFNLSTRPFVAKDDIPGAALAIWNGESLVLTQQNGGWWDIAKLLWRYGLAPVKTMRLVKAVVGKFLKMYDEPFFPFESITQTAQDLGLLAVTAATGEQYLEENGIGGDFGRHVVQASTRVNYAQNLNFIHGLEAMVSMAAENARSIQGGNWQIFDEMIKASDAHTLLSTAVTAVKKRNGALELHTKYLEDFRTDISNSQNFDSVILAGPLQFSEIEFDETTISPVTFDSMAVPYVQLHVTLFTSPHLLSPAFFNLQPTEAVPRVILTTIPKDERRETGPEGVGSPGFFSISVLHTVTNPKTAGQEYLYKMFSASAPNSTVLTALLGLQSPSDESDSGISDQDITWIYRKLWDSYPYEYPRVTFERCQLADNLWYTGGMDSFISTMETNALMGMNVARLIVDKWREESGR